MTPSPSPIRFPARSSHTPANQSAHKAADLESMAQLVEHQIPKFKDAHDKQFYREVVQTYRTAARDILRKASDDRAVRTLRSITVSARMLNP
jgi:hypothetical protein